MNHCRTFTERNNMTKRFFMIIGMMIGMVFAALFGASIASADTLEIPQIGISIEIPAEISNALASDPIAEIDRTLGQALPQGSKLPDIAQNVGDQLVATVQTLITGDALEAPVHEPTSQDTSLSQQWEQSVSYYEPEVIQPDESQCVDGAVKQQVACATARTNNWYEDQGIDQESTTILLPKYALGVWPFINNGQVSVCGMMPGMGPHHCDGLTMFEENDIHELLTSDNATTSVAIHESAHGLQEAAGLNPAIATLVGPAETIYSYEQGGDCLSGAYSASLSPEEGIAAYQRVYGIGIEGEKSHGSPSERGDAFLNGYYGGTGACNMYTPDHTVFPKVSTN